MQSRKSATVGVLVLWLMVAAGLAAQPPDAPQALSEQELDKLLPASIFLDGENAPVQRRNAVGARLQDGKLLLVTLIDTSGYSSEYQETYVGVVLAQGYVVFGDISLPPGAYGLGKREAMEGPGEDLVFYDLGGNLVAEVAAEEDEALRPVTPIQLKVEEGEALLYLGRYFVSVSAE